MEQDGPGHWLGLCVGSFVLGPVLTPVDGDVDEVEYDVVVVVCVGVYIGAVVDVGAVVVDTGVLVVVGADVVVLVGSDVVVVVDAVGVVAAGA